jgi:hypothetical protein
LENLAKHNDGERMTGFITVGLSTERSVTKAMKGTTGNGCSKNGCLKFAGSTSFM